MTKSAATEKIGKKVLSEFALLRSYYELLKYCAKHIRVLSIAPIRTVLYRQVFFTGIEAMSRVVILGTLVGIVIITQVASIVGVNALLTGKILLWIVVRELGPLLSAIIVITRSATAISSELASMKIEGEVDNLRLMGINPTDYLIVPRIAGITVSIFILSFYFQFAAVAGGLALSSVFMDFPLIQHIEGIFSALSISEVIVSLFKSLIFGLLISTVACYQGLSVHLSITEIPQAAAKAVMQCLFVVFIADGIISVFSSYL